MDCDFRLVAFAIAPTGGFFFAHFTALAFFFIAVIHRAKSPSRADYGGGGKSLNVVMISDGLRVSQSSC